MSEIYVPPGYATEGNLLSVLHEARFAGGIAASGQRAGFGGNLFTRDACRMELDTMDKLPSMTRELLSILPQTQGVEYDPATNEFPDAMPHQTFRQIVEGRRLPDKQVEQAEHWTGKWGMEMQDDPESGKSFTIYNSSDGPPLYLITLAAFARLHGKDVLNDEFKHRPTGEVRTVGKAGRRCVDFIMKSIEESEEKGLGLYAVPNTNPKQTSPSGVMRDGFDSYFYPEGESGEPVDFSFMAYIDNQGLAYEALRAAADELYPEDEKAPAWRAKAEEIRQRTIEKFWMEDEQFFAAAVDADGKQVKLASSAAAELVNGPFFKEHPDGPDYVGAIMRWVYDPQVMTPAGVRNLPLTFSRFEGDYYSYQGTGAVWPHVNGIVAKGMRNHWGLHRLSYDLGAKRTLGLFSVASAALELVYVHRENNEPVYEPRPEEARCLYALGATAIAAAEVGQTEQGWAASAGLREIWDWKGDIPEEPTGSWQRKLTDELMEIARDIPPAGEVKSKGDYFVDLEQGRKLKEKRAHKMGLAA